MAKSILTLLTVLSFSSLAHAEYFACSFTEPFFNLFISTSSNIVSVDHYGEYSKSLKIVASREKNGVLSLTLNDGKTIEINKNKVGNDGMSDMLYPYDVKYGHNWGGCEAEQKVEGNVIELYRSVREKNGLSLVDYWPGELGYVMGYKAKKSVKIAAKDTWSSVKNSKVGQADCTLAKDKLIVHSEKSRFEKYVSLWPVHEFTMSHDAPDYDAKKGDILKLVSYFRENYCYVNNKGKIIDMYCPEGEFENNEDSGVDYGEISPYGNYALLQCQEGHYSWIHSSVFDNDSESFEVINLGF